VRAYSCDNDSVLSPALDLSRVGPAFTAENCASLFRHVYKTEKYFIRKLVCVCVCVQLKSGQIQLNAVCIVLYYILYCTLDCCGRTTMNIPARISRRRYKTFRSRFVLSTLSRRRTLRFNFNFNFFFSKHHIRSRVARAYLPAAVNGRTRLKRAAIKNPLAAEEILRNFSRANE